MELEWNGFIWLNIHLMRKCKNMELGWLQRGICMNMVLIWEIFLSSSKNGDSFVIVGFSCLKKMLINQLDKKSAFLNRELNEEVFVEQPKGFELSSKDHLVYKLHKALYGLKHPPRAWYWKIDAYFLGKVFIEVQMNTLSRQRLHLKLTSVSVYLCWWFDLYGIFYSHSWRV